MRRRNITQKAALKVVKELDAFPKVPESYLETSASGGGVSILVFLFIFILVFSEVRYYASTDLRFDYEVDNVIDEKMKINIDMTIAMKCAWIGADVLDLTGQDTNAFGRLQEEETWFELDEEQKKYLDMIKHVNEYIRSEYHAVQDFLWKAGYMGMGNHMPKRAIKPDTPPDSCRVHGSLTLNKVAGNFHVTAGKSIPVIPRGHAHLAMMVQEKDYNFSHRIDQFSFGDNTPGIVNPLDGDYKVANTNYHMFQYFIQVVPTKVSTVQANSDSYQFAVTEKNRTINHGKGSHGVPGIFVKYDLSSFKVHVKEEYKPWWQFLVRLCGIVGGVFATSGMLHGLVGFVVDVLCCRLRIGKYSQGSSTSGMSDPSSVPVTLTSNESLINASTGVSLVRQDSASLLPDPPVQNSAIIQ